MPFRSGLSALVLPLFLLILVQWGCGGGSASPAPAPTALAPVITQQPIPLTVKQGSSASLSVGATGTAPLSYQWKKEGANLAGATAPTLTLASAQAADAGGYSVLVSNTAGSVSSASATLTVVVPPTITSQPASLTVNQGQAASLSVVASGSAPISYQWKKNGLALNGATAPVLSLVNAQPADAGAYAVDVSNAAGSVTSANATLAVVVPPVITTQPVGLEVIQGQPANLSVVASGTTPLTYQWKKGGTVLAGATASTFSLASAQPTDAGSYSAEVFNAAGSTTSDAASLVVLVPPGITTQPANQTVNQGQPVSFNVVATGTAPLSYQWKKGGVDVAGATASTYSIPTAQPADMASYSVDISNRVGSVSSIAAALVVVIPPTITTQPLDSNVNERQPASFSVVASGSGPFSYQWQKDGTALSGAVASTFTLASALPTDAGSYSVEVSNAAGRVKSQPAVLVVNPLAIIKTFKVLPSAIPLGGGGVLQWDVSGATTLSVNQGVGNLATPAGTINVGPQVTTTYTLTATNSAGPNAADATLTVDPTPFKLMSFSASPAQVDFGQTTTLGWAHLGLPLALSLDGTPVSGLSALAAPVRRQTYVLQGNNQGGSDRRTLKVATRGIDLVAGNVRGSGSQDGVGPNAWFNYPSGVAVDAAGSVYVADSHSHTIRKVDPDGRVSTFAGEAGSGIWSDGTGAAARFQFPNGVALDAAGNVYVADTGNATIRKISPMGVVTTLAGGRGQIGMDDGTGLAARFNLPNALVVDPAGNVIVADTGNHTIRVVSPQGVVSTLAGTPGLAGSGDGTVGTATFNSPRGVALDGSGAIYVADSGNYLIRKITPAGMVSTVAGLVGISGFSDGDASVAKFQYPTGIVTDALGNLYVSDSSNYAIRKITASGQVSTLAGVPGYRGSADGIGGAAQFDYPLGVALDPSGNLYVADYFNQVIRRITPGRLVSTLAGSPEQRGSTEGIGDQARFYNPTGLAVDSAGNIYVADSANRKVRLISPSATVSTLAGRGLSGNADGNAATATFQSPWGIAIDGMGNVFVCDETDHTIRKINPAGDVSTFAGSHGLPGFVDGPGASARFNTPYGLAADGFGNVYVADYFNHAIRKITTAGVVSTLAGTPGIRGYQDGPGASAQFNYPTGVGVDAAGNVYVADSSNSVIRKITPAGLVTTLAGYPLWAGTLDGIGSAARFGFPEGLAVDAGGTVFVADTSNQTIRKITPDGTVTTVGGQVNRSAFNPGPLPGLLVDPQWIAVTPDGDLIVVCHNGIVQITAP